MKKGLRAIFGVSVGILSMATFLAFVPPKDSPTVAKADVDVVAEYKSKSYEEQKEYPLFFRAVSGDVNITLTKSDDIEISTDNKQWRLIEVEEIVEIKNEEIVYYRTEKNSKDKMPNNSKFIMNGEGQVEAYGNIMSLLLRENFSKAETVIDCCFYKQFENCEKLLSAPLLPAKNLGASCYQFLFSGCKNLEKAPLLQATSIYDYCYFGMFQGCEKLNEIHVNFNYWAPQIYATTLWVDEVAEKGTFYCSQKLPKEYSSDCIPTGWDLGMTWENEKAIGFSGEYDGQVHEIKVKIPNNVSSDVKISYAISDTENGVFEEIKEMPSISKAGIVWVKVKFEAENYKTEEVKVCLSITPKVVAEKSVETKGDSENAQNLEWLWWILGGIGALITIIVVCDVKTKAKFIYDDAKEKQKQENYVRKYMKR